MSIMEKLFGAPKPVAQAVPNQMPQQAPVTNNLSQQSGGETQQTAQTAPNGVVPAQGEQKDESPMAKFNELWQPAKTDPNAPNPESNGFSPEKMMEAAGKVDFSKVLSREDLSKISAGGEDAVNAFANALNKTAQTVFGQSTVVTQKLIEKAQADTRAEVMKEVSGLIRKQTLSDGLAQDNPAFRDPALQPVIEALQNQLAEKYPKATSQELRTMAQEYLTGAASIIAPKTKDSGAGPARKDQNTDWEKYFAM